MGSFDIVKVPCPVCGEKVDFQSKGGRCEFKEYDVDEAPPEIAGDLNDREEECSCGTTVRLTVQFAIWGFAVTDEPTVRLLKHCPNCGSGDVRWDEVSVRPYCAECKTWGRVNHSGKAADAIESWNARSKS